MKNIITIIIVLFLLAGSINHLNAQRRSETLALGLSIGCSAICCLNDCGLPLALTFTPSLGHYYAGSWSTGLIFTGLRVTTLMAMSYPLLPDDTADTNTGMVFTCIGICGFITLIEWSLIPTSVEYHNARLQVKPEMDIQNGEYALGISYNF
ncbi:MAG: hypothetical protein JSW02_10625 [candidate division WOR-3 bacterium]|nr:MAG: hypothetical protein JSW02_10625 [candidate division WOR-3 bacterium]